MLWNCISISKTKNAMFIYTVLLTYLIQKISVICFGDLDVFSKCDQAVVFAHQFFYRFLLPIHHNQICFPFTWETTNYDTYFSQTNSQFSTVQIPFTWSSYHTDKWLSRHLFQLSSTQAGLNRFYLVFHSWSKLN